MIQVKDISFGYSKSDILFDNLSFTLQSGHIYGLLGKNGAGKSSLLRNMAGLLYPSKGELVVNGFSPSERKPAFLQDIYFVPEELYLPPLRVSSYLDCMASFYPNFDESRFWELLREFEIPEGNKLTGMSFGQKKKFATAFGLATNTKVLIMDEPTNGLDIPSKGQFRRVVAASLDLDKIILISTHQVRDLDNLIDRVMILENSEILIHHSLEEIEQKLYFGHLPTIEKGTDVLFSEQSVKGYSVVMENKLQAQTQVHMEHLFGAATENPNKIKQIFK